MKNRLCLAAALLVTLSLGAYAQTKPVSPKRNEAILVIKVRLQPGVQEDFFKNYASAKKRGDTVTKAYLGIGAYYGYMTSTGSEIGPLNQFGYVKASIPKDRNILFRSFEVRLADHSSYFINFPLNVRFTVPEDTPYVYLGTFVYRYSDEYFTMLSFERVDEFDEALAELRAALGPEVKLARAVYKETD
jgi:hypothetical protein